jgi:hypothetical protein
MGGYAYAYSDSMTDAGTSTACIDSTALCVTGVTDVSGGSDYGAGLGINLNQAQQGTTCDTPANSITVPAASVGISYALSGTVVATSGLIAIGNYDGVNALEVGKNEDYCATITELSGTIPWTQFSSQTCGDDLGDLPLTGPPTAPTHIQFKLPPGPTAFPFNFCVTSLAFASCQQPNGPCTVDSECCQTGTDVGSSGAYCITSDGLCHSGCTASSNCSEDCCVELSGGGAACFSPTAGYTCL